MKWASDECISAALTRVNEIRAEHGYKPTDCLPLGFTESDTCPIAVALSDGDNMHATVHGSVHGLSEVEVHILTFTDGIFREETTSYRGEAAIGEFVERFDEGLLPEYRLEY